MFAARADVGEEPTRAAEIPATGIFDLELPQSPWALHSGCAGVLTRSDDVDVRMIHRSPARVCRGGVAVWPGRAPPIANRPRLPVRAGAPAR